MAMTEIDYTCDQCQALMINGVYCHETGCPNAHSLACRKCDECEIVYFPKYDRQRVCLQCQ